jgi:hypothetical protein
MSRRAGTGDKPALFALIGIAIVFSFVIGRGWKTLFTPYGSVPSWLAAAVIVVVALSLCWAVASERIHHPHAKGAVLAYLFFLINLSALGTINTMFLQFQGGSVVRSEIDKAIIATTKIKVEGSSLIDTREYDEYDGKLSRLMSDLKTEIENPLNCGQGPRATDIINEIKRLVPGFQPLSLGGNCQNFSNREKVEQTINNYNKKIEEGKKLSPIYIAKRGEILAKSAIESGAAEILKKIGKIPREINGDNDLYLARSQLEEVAQSYLGIRQELAARANGRDKELAQSLDITGITSLGNIGQVIPFILSRLNDLATYVYVALAVILDFAVIAAFMRVITPAGRNVGRQRSPVLL